MRAERQSRIEPAAAVSHARVQTTVSAPRGEAAPGPCARGALGGSHGSDLRARTRHAHRAHGTRVASWRSGWPAEMQPSSDDSSGRALGCQAQRAPSSPNEERAGRRSKEVRRTTSNCQVSTSQVEGSMPSSRLQGMRRWKQWRLCVTWRFPEATRTHNWRTTAAHGRMPPRLCPRSSVWRTQSDVIRGGLLSCRLDTSPARSRAEDSSK